MKRFRSLKKYFQVVFNLVNTFILDMLTYNRRKDPVQKRYNITGGNLTGLRTKFSKAFGFV